jgi:predicted metal-binding membrane protein
VGERRCSLRYAPGGQPSLKEQMLEPRGPRSVAVDRTTIVALAALVAASALAWVVLVTYEPPMSFLGFTVGWSLMMAAMMLPSIAPLWLLYRGSRVGMAVGYLAVWSVVGVVPYVAMERAMGMTVPVVLGLAGVYELSPLKSACLRRCRNPAAFLMEHYRSGAVRLGVEHGIWCLGCCVGLMAVLVLAASMQLVWAVVIAGAVFVQKVLPRGELSARLIGIGLLVAALAVAVT